MKSKLKTKKIGLLMAVFLGVTMFFGQAEIVEGFSCAHQNGSDIGCGWWVRQTFPCSTGGSCMINPQSATSVFVFSDCQVGNEVCSMGGCPNTGLYDGDVCFVGEEGCYDWGSLQCGSYSAYGRWDASDRKCVICNGNREDKVCATTAWVSVAGNCSGPPDGSGTCPTDSAAKDFESACGADAGCDEQDTGDACSPPAGGSCDASGACVAAAPPPPPPGCTCAADTPACCDATCEPTGGDLDCDCVADFGGDICNSLIGETCPGTVITFHDAGGICCDVPCTSVGAGYVVYLDPTTFDSYAAGDCAAGPAQFRCGNLDGTDDDNSCPTGDWDCEDDDTGTCSATCGVGVFCTPVAGCAATVSRCTSKYDACDCTCAAPAPVPGAEICVGGIDEDGDGLIDCADPDCAADPACAGPGAEICVGGIDEDGDGLIDCADPDCAADPACVGVCVANGAPCTTNVECCSGICNIFGGTYECIASSGGAPVCTTGGLIPCGRNCDIIGTSWIESDPCTLCHLVLMGQLIIEFLVKMAAIFAILALVGGGIVYVFSIGSAGTIEKAKTIIKYALLGFVVVFIAWAVITSILTMMGYADPLGGDWHMMDC